MRFPIIIIYLMLGIAILSYAMYILTPDRRSIQKGIHSMRSAKIHDRLIMRNDQYHSSRSLFIKSVSEEMLNDLKSQA